MQPYNGEAGTNSNNPLAKLLFSSHTYRMVRISLGLVFVAAGAVKLSSPADFARMIGDFGILPSAMLKPAALILASLEILAGIGLVLEIYGALSLITGLTVLFILVLTYGISIGLDIDCGCFGAGDPEAKTHSSLTQALFRDILFLLAAFFLYFHRKMNPLPSVAPIPENHVQNKHK